MLLSSRGMIAARAMETRSLHPWCVQVSGEAALIPALGTLADLLLHLSLQLHLGIMSSSAPPPGVANAPLMDTLESTRMSFMSLIGSEPQPVLLSVQGLFHLLLLQLQPLAPLLHLHPLAPHLHLRRHHHQQWHLLLHQIQDAQLLVVMILARLASFHSDFKEPSTMPAPSIIMLLKIPSHGVPQKPMPMMITRLVRADGASVTPVVQ